MDSGKWITDNLGLYAILNYPLSIFHYPLFIFRYPLSVKRYLFNSAKLIVRRSLM